MGPKVIIEGNAKRESLVASGFVNERHFVLEQADSHSFRLCSYRRADGDESIPSKTWAVTPQTSVTPITQSTFKLRGEEDVTALGFLSALVRQKRFQQLQLHAFAIDFVQDSAQLWSGDKLTLCFDNSAAAEEWHRALTAAIDSCKLHAKSANEAKRRDLLTSEGSDVAAVMASLPSEQRMSLDDGGGGGGGGTSIATTTNTNNRNGNKSSSHASRSWESIHHVNGVAVYAEEEGESGEGGAIMASVVVRAPPRVCFHALMRGNNSAEALSSCEIPFTDSVTLLETIDAHTQCVKHSWAPEKGIGRWIAAPREVVALRTWRKEPDGTYILLYQSTTHRKARQSDIAGQGGWRTYLPFPGQRTPVRAHLEAAGFTISPLLPQYCPGGGPSQECLVTLVVKANVAGSLSPTSLLSRFAPVLADAARWKVLEPLLMSVVALRDRVEQRRFVVMPYTMAAEGDALLGLDDEDELGGVGGEHAMGVGVNGKKHARSDSVMVLTETGAIPASSPSPLPSPYASTPSPTRPVFQRTTTAITESSFTPTRSRPSPSPPPAAASPSPLPPSPRGGAALAPVAEEVYADANSFADEGSTSISTAALLTTTTTTTTPPPLSKGEDVGWAVGGTTPKQYWSFPGSSYLRIRGPNYLNDRVKIPALPPMFDLYASDLVDADEPQWGVAASLPSMRHCPAPFAFVLNLMYPANGMLQSLVTTWTAPVNVEEMSEDALVEAWGGDGGGGGEGEAGSAVRAFFRNFKTWMEGDGDEADQRRNIKFKLIPRVAQGSWVVKQSVGTTPVLLGQKLKTKYFRGKSESGCCYFECDVDITSNTVANSVTRLVVNSITSLVVDLAPLVEGQAPDELPERLIGSVRYDHLNLRTAAIWDEGAHQVVPRRLEG